MNTENVSIEEKDNGVLADISTSFYLGQKVIAKKLGWGGNGTPHNSGEIIGLLVAL